MKRMDNRLPDKTTEDMYLYDLKIKGLNGELANKVLKKLTERGELYLDKDGWLTKP
jgi:hypothetical protein